MDDSRQHIPIVVLGAGIAGLSVANRIAKANHNYCAVFEQNCAIGGMASSFEFCKCIFDIGIHGLYTKDEEMLADFCNAVEGQHREFQPRVVDIWRNFKLPHPLQSNLYELPIKLRLRCLADVIKAKWLYASDDSPFNYKHWCLRNLGHCLSETFVFPYVRKFWTVEPEELTTEWMGPRMRIPSLFEILRGMLLHSNQNVHYIRTLFYPNRGGFGAYINGFEKNAKVYLKKRVIAINTELRIITFEDNTSVSYGLLVSTLPLPELIQVIVSKPEAVVKAANLLRATSLALVSYVLKVPPRVKYEWIYSYDSECVFARASVPTLWSQENAPERKSSVQAEVYFMGTPPVAKELEAHVRRDLFRIGIILNNDDIEDVNVSFYEYANVIYDHNRRAALTRINAYLNNVGIKVTGKYGLWDYSLVSDVKRNAESVADEILSDKNGFMEVVLGRPNTSF